MGWRSRLLGRDEDEVRPSIEKRVEAGTVLFRAGDSARAVALILEGEIELLAEAEVEANAGESAPRSGTRGRGAYIGDDEVLGDGVWHRTARAVRQTRLEMLPRDVFLERIAHRSTANGGSMAAADPVAALTVRLLPASPETAAALPAGGLAVVELPFTVGRAGSEPQAPPASGTALLLEERPPYRLSRRQFSLSRTACGVAISDPGSRLGTFVRGLRIGSEPIALPSGETVEIIAGGPQSPFRFQLITP